MGVYVQGMVGWGVLYPPYLLQFLLPATVFLSYQPFLTLKCSFQSSNRERVEESRKGGGRESERAGLSEQQTGAFGTDWT